MIDNADNQKYCTPNGDYSFTIINNGEVDVTPPQLISFEIDKTEVEAGDTITVTAKVTDDISGVSSVYVSFEGKAGGVSPGISLYKTDEEYTYKGMLTIGKYEEPRKQRVRTLQLLDNAGNWQSYTPVEDYSFTVINNEEVDVTPPELVSLEFDTTEVVVPGTVNITAKVVDELSGVKSVSIHFGYGSRGGMYGISLIQTEQDSIYKGILEIEKNENPYTPYTLVVNMIYLEDNAGNWLSYLPIEDYIITVLEDISPPIITDGRADRISNTEARISFKTSESGTAYYKVVEKGESITGITDLQDIKSLPSIGEVSEGLVSDKVLGLSAGAKDLYIYVVDKSGNFNSGFKINVDAYANSSGYIPSIPSIPVNPPVPIEPTQPEPVEPELPELKEVPFRDVEENAWYYNSIRYVYNYGLMKGVSETRFEPMKETNRGMLVTILYRLEGSPETSTKSKFVDVNGNEWYANAVSWAAESRIINGFPDGTFKPIESLTREQLATILYNYSKYKGYDISGLQPLDKFKDGKNVSNYAKAAMEWAVKNEIITGVSDNELSPNSAVTRAQMAVILERFIKNIVK